MRFALLLLEAATPLQARCLWSKLGQSNYAANGDYIEHSGTSMAAPQVSGIAAALMEKFPSLNTSTDSNQNKNTAVSGLYNSSGISITNIRHGINKHVWKRSS